MCEWACQNWLKTQLMLPIVIEILVTLFICLTCCKRLLMLHILLWLLPTISLGPQCTIWQATIIKDSKNYIVLWTGMTSQEFLSVTLLMVSGVICQSFSREEEMFGNEIWKAWLWMIVPLNSSFLSPAVCLYRYFSLTWCFTTEDGLSPVICAYCFDSVAVLFS